MCGEDYDQVFAPTMTSETLKVALCKAGAEGMFVHHFDFMTAYLTKSCIWNKFLGAVISQRYNSTLGSQAKYQGLASMFECHIAKCWF